MPIPRFWAPTRTCSRLQDAAHPSMYGPKKLCKRSQFVCIARKDTCARLQAAAQHPDLRTYSDTGGAGGEERTPLSPRGRPRRGNCQCLVFCSCLLMPPLGLFAPAPVPPGMPRRGGGATVNVRTQELTRIWRCRHRGWRQACHRGPPGDAQARARAPHTHTPARARARAGRRKGADARGRRARDCSAGRPASGDSPFGETSPKGGFGRGRGGIERFGRRCDCLERAECAPSPGSD